MNSVTDYYSVFGQAIETYPFSITLAIIIIICILLIIISALLSASELAFFSFSPTDLNKLEATNSKNNLLKELRSKPETLLATILVVNNFVNVGFIILATYASSLLFKFVYAPILGLFLQAIIITFILLLFCEILPKIYATNYSLKIAQKSATLIKFSQIVFYPLVKLLTNSTSYFNKRIANLNRSCISVDELSDALKLTSESSNEDNDILEGIVKFGNINVNQIMTPRTQMVDIEVKSTFKQVLNLIIESGYSRMPVYSETEDNIRGILYIKDLLPHLKKGDSFRWQSLIRPAYFVPETKMIDDLLADFQKNKIHIAIVVDEFGGTSGLITLEDILEEIVGEINDEYDEEEDKLFTVVDKNTLLFEAKIMLTDFYKVPGVDEDPFSIIATEVDTLAGLILEIKGDIPSKDEKIDFAHYTFEIIEADARHIKKVKLHIHE